jgi:hypothetical protein
VSPSPATPVLPPSGGETGPEGDHSDGDRPVAFMWATQYSIVPMTSGNSNATWRFVKRSTTKPTDSRYDVRSLSSRYSSDRSSISIASLGLNEQKSTIQGPIGTCLRDLAPKGLALYSAPHSCLGNRQGTAHLLRIDHCHGRMSWPRHSDNDDVGVGQDPPSRLRRTPPCGGRNTFPRPGFRRTPPCGGRNTFPPSGFARLERAIRRT